MYKTFTVGAVLTVLSAFAEGNNHNAGTRINMPYRKMGLSQRQAAAHLLSRFTFGIRPGEIDEVMKMGPDKWLKQQWEAGLPDEEVAKRLTGYDALDLNNDSIVNTYLNGGQVLRIAVRKNVVNKDSVQAAGKKEYQDKLRAFMNQEGYKPMQELQRQLINQKIIRSAYGQNQLQEVMTDFWFNHFNVSLTKNQCEQFVLTYERDAIRANALGNFETMLVATAKHPAMLEYLDNASSVSNNNELSRKQERAALIQRVKQQQGLNENYAREIMELHTLGVDGGYTQQDVTELARALTGWSPAPLYNDGLAKKIMDRVAAERMEKQGFVREGDFLFRANKHDEGEKTILGRTFAANGGYKEGMDILHMLANHPSTATFICTKIATRFVADTPSADLVHKMAGAFLQSKGDIRSVIIAMVNSREFWDDHAFREKIKSPFEFAISAIRATDADVQQPFQVYNWCMKMGQRFYYYQAPTGFPDRAAYWINTGSLLNRMNFGLAFATEKIPGIKLNLIGLNDNHEPESADAALEVYSKLLLPERNHEANIRRLTAMVRDVNLAKKINEKAVLHEKTNTIAMAYVAGNNAMVSQVAGIIIGSPEFQRK